MASYLFAGPTQQVVDLPFDDGTGRPLGPRVARQLGLNVYRYAGQWFAELSPSYERWTAADRAYLGGHIHPVSAAEAAELTAAGYGAYLTPIPDPVPYFVREVV